MKSVVDLFVAKDRTAIFWFVMACASITASALFVSMITASVSEKPRYVVMDANNVYYLVSSDEFINAKAMHEAMTRTAMETLFTRDNNGLKFEGRRERMFYGKSVTAIDAELEKESRPFKDRLAKQTIEIGEVKFPDPTGLDTHIKTVGTGTVTRESTIEGKVTTEQFKVNVLFAWMINSNIHQNSLYPSVCVDIRFFEPKKIEAE